jgi:hypothetical protein
MPLSSTALGRWYSSTLARYKLDRVWGYTLSCSVDYVFCGIVCVRLPLASRHAAPVTGITRVTHTCPRQQRGHVWYNGPHAPARYDAM